MKLTKYQQLLLQNVKEQLHQWFHSPIDQHISVHEVTHFLITTKYCASSLQLIGLEQICDILLLRVEEKNKPTYTSTELHLEITELINLSIEWNYFSHEQSSYINLDEKIPLIYIVDEDVSTIILLKDILENLGYIVVGHTDPKLALKQLYDVVPDCIVLNSCFSNKSGVEFLKELNFYFGKKFIPKIMISTENTKELRLQAFHYQIDDFITKPIVFDEFVARLQRLLDRKELFDQSILMDELTQAYNRKYLNDVLVQEEQKFLHKKRPYSVAILDLDFFKKVNDTYGHLVGDKVLIFFVNFLKKKIRPVDTLCRFGGEEFILVLPNMTGNEAKDRITAYIEEFKNIAFYEKGETFHISFSAGICSIESDVVEKKTILTIADHALYYAKNNGRSRAELATNLELEQRISFVVIDREKTYYDMIQSILEGISLPTHKFELYHFETIAAFNKKYTFVEKREQYFFVNNIYTQEETLNLITTIKSYSQTKITLFTCRELLEEISIAIRFGADDYMPSPIKLSDLENRIQRQLRK